MKTLATSLETPPPQGGFKARCVVLPRSTCRAFFISKRKEESILKWFKHNSYSRGNAKLEKLLMKYGVEGYGLYFYCLEIIASELAPENITFELEHDSEILAHRLKMDSIKIEEIMKYCVSIGLFEINQLNMKITCLGLAQIADDYTSKNPEIKKITSNIKKSDKVRQSPSDSDQITLDKTTLKQIKEDKSKKKDIIYTQDFLNIWAIYNEGTKKTAFKAFNTRLKEGVNPVDLLTSCKVYVDDCAKNKRFLKHVSTFLGPDEHWREFFDSEKMQAMAEKEKAAQAEDNFREIKVP